MRYLIAAAVVGVAVANAAHASIPPRIAVKVVSEDRETEARTRALVEVLSTFDNFLWVESYVGRGAVLDCLRKTDADNCARALIRSSGAPAGAPTAILIVRERNGADVELQCLGSGKTAPDQDKQRATIDLQFALFGSPELRANLRRSALQCLWSAAAEDATTIKRD